MSDIDKPQSKPDPATPSRPAMSRREFARRAALTALAPAALVPVASAPASAQSPATQATPAAKTPPASAQAPSDPNLPRLSPESQAEADARAQSILAQYAARFSDDQKADIRRLCILAQPPLDRLRAYHLQNGDGEALYLKPLVEREKKPATILPAPAAAPGRKPTAKRP